MPDPVPFAEEIVDPVGYGREDEALFARDDNDILVRREKETRERFGKFVTITVDGFPVEVPRAVPKTDAQGVPLRDGNGELIPRTTSIYDAAGRLVHGYQNSRGEYVSPAWSETELKARIPVLCHMPHLNPVGMCRMCSVHISSLKRGKLTPGRKLVPACQHRVEENMVVTTRAGLDGYNPAAKAAAPPDQLDVIVRAAGTVDRAVGLLAEMLLADHRHPPLAWDAGGTVQAEGRRYENELEAVAGALGVDGPRPRLSGCPEVSAGQGPDLSAVTGRNALQAIAPEARAAAGLADERRDRRIALPIAPTRVDPEGLPGPADRRSWDGWNELIDERFPYSSRTVVVDHDRCILCDRCVRSCSDVKPFKVIGHTGKGYTTRISFDLDAVMGESSCVQCGECMTSCPTGALTLRRRVLPRAWADSPGQIPQNPNTPFPPGSGFLTADEMREVWLFYDSPTRGPRTVFPFASIPYAYLKWNEGSVRRWRIEPGPTGPGRQVLCREGEYGSTAFLLRGTGSFELRSRPMPDQTARPGLLGRLLGRTAGPAAGHPDGELIRTAGGTELILGEMACLTHRRRNATVTAVADREPVVVYEITRNMLDMMQRSESARADLEEMYTGRAVQVCVAGGRMFGGLPADRRAEVSRFLIGSGKLSFRRAGAGETIVAEGDPASNFYIVRLGTIRVFRTVGGREQVLKLLSAGDYFGEGALLPGGSRRRAATVAALDPVELVAVPGQLFVEMCDRFPEIRRYLEEEWARAAGLPPGPTPGVLGEYVGQGLYQGQKLLALDLLSCTRCDECTKACADSHDGHARLLREGLRFGDFLVATSCRSCHTPYCMEGCPVDAIHRRGAHLEVIIENHCIGCGLCEKNCPYGAIQMVPRAATRGAGLALGAEAPLIAAPRRAANCDLCNGDEPFCVQACPHEAAFRLTGPDLLKEVTARAAWGE
ncbi:MAG: hypothetical protein JWO38_5976 [Gemmataceae bacterium]|nr:hypothetical protein [Gemmataceae bacterium]